MFSLPIIYCYRDQSLDSIHRRGTIKLDSCLIKGRATLAGMIDIKKSRFVEKANLSGTIDISDTKFANLVAAGALKIISSKLENADVSGELALTAVQASCIVAKSDEITVKACNINELVLTNQTFQKKPILRVGDKSHIKKVIFRDIEAEVIIDNSSKITSIIPHASNS